MQNCDHYKFFSSPRLLHDVAKFVYYMYVDFVPGHCMSLLRYTAVWRMGHFSSSSSSSHLDGCAKVCGNCIALAMELSLSYTKSSICSCTNPTMLQSYIPQCTILEEKCQHFCNKRVHCGIFVQCIMEFVSQSIELSWVMTWYLFTGKSSSIHFIKTISQISHGIQRKMSWLMLPW